MSGDEEHETDDDIESNIFGFFEFFLISGRDEHEPSCVDDESYSDEHDETIDERKYLSKYTDSSLEFFLSHHTVTDREKSRVFTGIFRFSVDSDDKKTGYAYEEKSDHSVDHDIFSFFEFFLIATTRHDDVKCIYHHEEETKSCHDEHEVHERLKYIAPKLPSEATIDILGRLSEVERAPDGCRYLHDDDTHRCPYDVSPPFFDIFLISPGEEELEDSDDEKYHRNSDEKVLERKGNTQKCIDHRLIAQARHKKEFTYRSDKCRECI